jgi:hypothetical protein
MRIRLCFRVDKSRFCCGQVFQVLEKSPSYPVSNSSSSEPLISISKTNVNAPEMQPLFESTFVAQSRREYNPQVVVERGELISIIASLAVCSWFLQHANVSNVFRMYSDHCKYIRRTASIAIRRMRAVPQ